MCVCFVVVAMVLHSGDIAYDLDSDNGRNIHKGVVAMVLHSGDIAHGFHSYHVVNLGFRHTCIYVGMCAYCMDMCIYYMYASMNVNICIYAWMCLYILSTRTMWVAMFLIAMFLIAMFLIFHRLCG